jgi:UDP-N-acetylmuramoyl-tripeptide--D-alanyl-D-alanine ligase
LSDATSRVLVFHVVVALIWSLPLALDVRRSLHILQLEEYSNRRFLRWAATRGADGARLFAWLGVLLAATITFVAFSGQRQIVAVLDILWLIPAAAMAASLRPQPAKKPLVYTARIRRLIAGIAGAAIVLAAVVAALWNAAFAHHGSLTTGVGAASGAVAILLLTRTLLVVGGNLLTWPLEEQLRRRYLGDARRRVRRLDPTIIGITGSYGKTTTKELLAAMLRTRFTVANTPESWNTLMGVTRTIRDRLHERDEIFVVEMGAYKRGEIAALCRLTGPPRIGILTGINEQHLERFGGIQNTIRAKYELIEAVQPGGLAVFNAENAYCRDLASRTEHARVVRVGLEPEHGPFEYWAEDVAISRDGTRFTVRHGVDAVPFRTNLLGEHFIINILAATAAAEECGMSLQQVAAAVAAIPPVPHRLQLIPSSSGITTIDDAYSANPDGARAALRVLSQMNGGRRFLVTPGFVELGEREDALNRDLGSLAASSCDILVLVGPRRTQPIREGAVAAGMDAAQIEVVQSVADAHTFLGRMTVAGDTILFENDLPDNYDE